MYEESHLKYLFTTFVFILAMAYTAVGQIIYVDAHADDRTNQYYIDSNSPMISGYVTEAAGNAVSGVHVPADNGGGVDITDNNGYYELSVPNDWSGTVTPTKTDYVLSPTSRIYQGVTSDITDQSFLISPEPSWSGTTIGVSASMGSPGQTSGLWLGHGQFLGVRFHLKGFMGGPVSVKAIGGHMYQYVDGNFFGAIVSLSGPDALPTGSPFKSSEVVASVVFDPGKPSSDFRVPLSVNLPTGDYALIFGSEALGSSHGSGGMPHEGQVDYTQNNYILWNERGWFNCTPIPGPPRFVIEGYITVPVTGHVKTPEGTGIEGVKINAFVNNTGNYYDYTDANGYYEVKISYDGFGTVTPSKGRWRFEPVSRTYHDAVSPETDQDYTAIRPLIICGHITEANGVGAEQVLVSADNGGGSGTTDANGYYELEVPSGWSGTVTPGKSGWSLFPANRSYNDVKEDLSDQDFTIGRPPIISGHVEDANGIRVEGVLVSADNGGSSGSTDANGLYEVTVPYNWSGMVSLTVDEWGWGAIPKNRSYVDIIEDLSNQDYVIHGPQIISGRITDTNGFGTEGILVSTSDGVDSNSTDNMGYYELTVPFHWAGIVTPGKHGWHFSPVSRFYSDVITAQTNQDYARSPHYSHGGSGDPNDPYLIYTAAQMNAIGAHPNDWDKHFKLMASIDLSSYTGDSFNIIGNETTRFSGVFDGDGHEIVNFTYNEKSFSRNYIALFGYVDDANAEIRNLRLKKANVLASNSYYVGSLVGRLRNGTISNCYAEDVNVSGYSRTGGLAGYNSGTISKCASSGIILGYVYIGGLVGHNYGPGAKIFNCYSTAGILHPNPAPFIGGLVGENWGQINYCYSTGLILGKFYYDIGGLIGRNSGTVTNSFWDIETSGIDYSDGGTGKTTDEMQTQSTFTSAGWDFTTPVWKMPCQGCDYPILWYENVICIVAAPSILEFEAFLHGSNPESRNLSIRNCFVGTLQWEITKENGCDWLSVDPNSGTSTDNTDIVTVSVNTTFLPAGTYNCTLTISDPNAENSPQTVEVNLEVLGPLISVEPNSLAFEANKGNPVPPVQTISIENTGYVTLNWEISVPNDCNWLTVYPLTGASTGEVNQVTLSVDASGLDYGSYSCQLTVSDDDALNSPQIVEVNFDVIGPVISTTPNDLEFLIPIQGGTLPSQTLSIQNTGYDVLNWQIIIPQTCSWLTVYPLTGESTGEINQVTLSADANGMDIGVYNCALTIIDPNAENSSHIVRVSLHVYTAGQRHVPAEYSTIQAAVDAAVDGDEVIIGPGRYTGPGNYNIDFGGKSITVRSIEPTNPAVVAATIIDPNYYGIGFDFQNGEDNNSIVDGITIINGRKWQGYSSLGGIYCYYCSPTIRNCVIRECNSDAISLFHSDAIIKDCVISENRGPIYQSIPGAGIACMGSSPLISNCLISNNYCSGLQCMSSYPTVINCIFTGNRGSYDPYKRTSLGGGILFRGNDLSLINSTFSGNAAGIGGGICNYGWLGAYMNNMTISNCIFRDNIADLGPQIALTRFESAILPTVTVSYSDVQGGEEAVYVEPPCIFNWDDSNNLDIDPCFAEAGFWHDTNIPAETTFGFWVNGDYHLKSQKGRWKPSYIGLDPTCDEFINLLDFAAFANYWRKQGGLITADLDRSGIVDLADLRLILDNYLMSYTPGQWVFDNVTSPCIDAGDPNSDWTEELWPHGRRINMGAYGGTPEASMSLSDAGNIADLDTDGRVDYNDAMLLTGKWLYDLVLLAEDLNRNGFINSTDFAIFANNWRLPSIQAGNPNPADGSTGVDPNTVLLWTAGSHATSHDVYFGTSSPPPFILKQTAAIFDPVTMAPDTTYYWRIDEVNPWGTTTGTIWVFKTISFEATNPNPADGEKYVSTSADLSWTAGPYADSHDVYFGTSNPPPFIRNQTDTIYDPGTMDNSTTYFWRIDEINQWGTTTGPVWSFTTIMSPPPP